MKVIKENIKDYTLEDYFRDNNISLDRQKELTKLTCYTDKLTSLEGIENCIQLKRLDCSNNELTSLEGIENCVKLEWLYCFNNQLMSLKGIENCTNLEWLYCDDLEDINQYKDKIKNIQIYIY
jgi:Leucine-rich repeat (LRR) protein